MGMTAATGSPFRVMTVGLPFCARVITAAKWARVSLTFILLSSSVMTSVYPNLCTQCRAHSIPASPSGAIERPGPAQPGVPDVGPLTLGVSGAVAPAAVGDAGLPGHGVRLLQLAPDDHGPVG